jgi:hypothetical protein
VHFFLYATIGMVTCMGIGWLASLVIPARDKDIHGLTVYTMREKARSPEERRPAEGVLVAER